MTDRQDNLFRGDDRQTAHSMPECGNDELHDQAIQYALGTLSPAEREHFAARLAASPALRERVEGYRSLGAELGTLVDEECAPEGLLDTVLARIQVDPGASGAQPWKDWNESAPPSDGIVRGDNSSFELTSIKGVEVRRLSLDSAAQRVTFEVRMAPGSQYPAHRHGGLEECFVLEGDLDVGGVEMQAGDFQSLPAGSIHPVQSTREGCRLLIVSSLHDKLLESS